VILSPVPEKHPWPRHVVVAVAPDPSSDPAVQIAIELMRRFDATLDFVHAVGSAALDWDVEDDPRLVARGEGLLQVATTQVVAHVDRVLTAQGFDRAPAGELVHVQAGQPAKVILDRAREKHADLIVLGALRRNAGVDFGSTARAVLAHAVDPVWVQPRAPDPIRRILVPVDLSEESLRALAKACSLAQRLGARVRAMKCFDGARLSGMAVAGVEAPVVVPPMDELREKSRADFERVMTSFDWKGVEHDIEFVDGSPAETILDREPGADLIAMGTHGRTGLSSALLGSVAYSVLKHATKPVMVVRRKDRSFLT
jgi:nucleotide-binding universal stress UspA family protein